MEVLSENDGGRRPLCHPSLVFMPHLEVTSVSRMRAMTDGVPLQRPCLDNFFESHVENRFLRQSLILCNSLSKIVEREETSPHPKGQALSRLLTDGALGTFLPRQQQRRPLSVVCPQGRCARWLSLRETWKRRRRLTISAFIASFPIPLTHGRTLVFKTSLL